MPSVDEKLAQAESALLRWTLRAVVAVVIAAFGSLFNRGIDKLDDLTKAVQSAAGDITTVKADLRYHELSSKNIVDTVNGQLKDHETRIRSLERGNQTGR